ERHARGEVVGAVAVEVAAGERPGEEVAALRGVEAEQVLVAEALRAHGREADGGGLRRRRAGEGQHGGDQNQGRRRERVSGSHGSSPCGAGVRPQRRKLSSSRKKEPEVPESWPETMPAKAWLITALAVPGRSTSNSSCRVPGTPLTKRVCHTVRWPGLPARQLQSMRLLWVLGSPGLLVVKPAP